jgi:hypothetical protein
LISQQNQSRRSRLPKDVIDESEEKRHANSNHKTEQRTVHRVIEKVADKVADKSKKNPKSKCIEVEHV